MDNITPVPELEIYLIRHAQSKANAGFSQSEEVNFSDRADPVLTERGLLQAKNLGEYLSDIDFSCIYSSGLKRAVMTAAAVREHQNENKKHLLFPLLTENGTGDDYKGASWDELKLISSGISLIDDLSPDTPILYYNDYKDEPSHFLRAKKVIDYLRSKHFNGEKICVVSHAAFITYIVFHLMGHEKTPAFDISFSNTGITKIEFYKPGTNKYGDVIFEYINDTSHLPSDMRTK